MSYQKSQNLFTRAQSLIPGGVNSPVRAFRSVGRTPPFILRAKGCRLYDVDGHSYIDYVGSWGPMIVGHAHQQVVNAIKREANHGTSYGAPTPLEVRLAEMIVAAVPSIEMVRLVSSGTEAVMSAIRLARAATKRDAIIKFDGGYHGHADSLLVKAGSGVATFGLPDSPGVPADLAKHTLTASYNDLSDVRRLFDANSGAVAAVIVEPIAGNMGVVPPAPGFLQGLRELTRERGALLIFDEVISGFRASYGGAQSLYGVVPDLTCLGKIIGGGLPVGAYGGRRDLMEMIAPAGPVYQAGTLSGNPLAVSAGIATLKLLQKPKVYEVLEARSAALADGLAETAKSAGVSVQINRAGSVLTVFFTATPVRDYATAKTADTTRFARFFSAMLDAGVYLPPSQFEAWFVSLAHTEREIERTLKAARPAFAEIAT
ncbi:MAG: glutamate-1-semialdehyde 2,1-aminomutase [Nitrospirota bacterium]